MAISWSFTLLLVLTLVAILTFSQPLFQSTSGAVVGHSRTDLETVSRAVIARGLLRQSLVASKAISEAGSAGDAAWSFDVLRRGRRRQRWARKLIPRSIGSPPSDELQQRDLGKRRNPEIDPTSSEFARRRSRTRAVESLGEYPPPATKARIPRRSVLATFQSDRMVPSGPNPLHNSNRSQVIFP